MSDMKPVEEYKILDETSLEKSGHFLYITVKGASFPRQRKN